MILKDVIIIILIPPDIWKDHLNHVTLASKDLIVFFFTKCRVLGTRTWNCHVCSFFILRPYLKDIT